MDLFGRPQKERARFTGMVAKSDYIIEFNIIEFRYILGPIFRYVNTDFRHSSNGARINWFGFYSS